VTTKATTKSAILTDIMLTIFRVNGRLLERGDQLVAPLALTSARWQVLGAVAMAGKPLSAPQVAEAMGITRQGAQKQLNKLGEEGFLEMLPNPRHERSPLFMLTNKGNRAMDATMSLQMTWANGLSAGLSLQNLKGTLETLNTLYELLDSPVPTKGAKS
jgi:DNA-binding MarR family transcriptional regulator